MWLEHPSAPETLLTFGVLDIAALYPGSSPEKRVENPKDLIT